MLDSKRHYSYEQIQNMLPKHPVQKEKSKWDDMGIIHRDAPPGGSIPTGGALNYANATEVKNVTPDSSSGIVEPKPPFKHSLWDNPIDAYHSILNMTPQQIELKREIAAQLLGAVPSRFWGDLLEGEDRTLKAPSEHYENLIRMPNAHAMGRLLEADHEYGDPRGGSFFDAIKHVGRIALNAYKKGRTAAILLKHFKDPLIESMGLGQYKGGINSILDAIGNMDDFINPIVELSLAAMGNSEAISPEKLKVIKEKAKELAMDKAKQVAEEQLNIPVSSITNHPAKVYNDIVEGRKYHKT